MSKVVVCGALGRMGMVIGGIVSESPDMDLVGGVDVKEGSFYGVPVAAAERMGAFLDDVRPDVIIDFTIAAAAVGNIRAASERGIALVVGTTGFSPDQQEEIRTAVEGHVPAVISSNFSVGVNLFWALIREAARRVPPDYDIEVTEAHHRYKQDAPSGTATTILDILDAERGPHTRVYGREGIAPRGDEIGVHVVRGGDIVGDHTVMFAGNHEVLELSHRAYDRAVFARGAVRAAGWVVGKEPGIYSMNDVLGLQ
ncbi:4-hydroxy-tetrahydrodipicolinate reductase [Methanofollis fontis]|uniref:4-hydroxy-tetrahydrodipicolinate reductase n=1 Tax=Methanofollis fontis TaxID=2052832 RepID=A0A483CTG5_9EURY|nr:4-hydroxy-tetrahydrodipicolinate reductase [Methanofollis fontis]TAJ44653.1 4-hydroxy-tetrahydrodipicolinate reductase [Methanofollis fontis]